MKTRKNKELIKGGLGDPNKTEPAEFAHKF